MLFTALAVFIGEYLVMFVLPLLRPLSIGTEAIIDATLLTTLVGPFLYLFLFRPMALQIEVRKKAEEELRRANTSLEQRVEERTAELARGNAMLRLEIDERRRAEDKLWRSNEFVRSLVESVPCILLIYDIAKHRCSFVNGWVTELLGYPQEEVCLQGRDFLSRILGDQGYASYMLATSSLQDQEDGAVNGGNYPLQSASGEHQTFMVKTVVLSRDPDLAVREILITATELPDE